MTVLAAWGPEAPCAEVSLVRTNWAERVITNLIEVRMPDNRFLNEYHTNWVTRTFTNQIVVEAVRTNVVEAFKTNWTTLTLTNWRTVVVMKTNWVTQSVTNVVQLDLPADPPAQTAASAASVPTEDLVLEATRTARPLANNQAEVVLKVRASGAAATPEVQQWKVERVDGGVLCFGQEQEFKRELVLGDYRVVVKVLRHANSPAVTLRGMLSVTAREAVIQQKLVVSK